MTEIHFKFINLIKDKKITKKEIARRLGVTMPTLNSRLENPTSFKLGEIHKLRTILNVKTLSIYEELF
jgi:transcriptional regulator with XRE-family HTH domain